MALTKQTSLQVFSLASEVLGDRNASEQARLLAATVLAHAPLPSAAREGKAARAESRHKPAPLLIGDDEAKPAASADAA